MSGQQVDILLVRHPETEANVNGHYVGRLDSPYTELGKRQFARVPRKIAAFKPDIVWSSHLLRARRLAERSARLASVPLRIDERLVELDFGDAEGLTYAQVQATGIPFNYKNLDQPVAPGGESRAQLEARTAAVCGELVAMGGRHVVVTHGGVFRAALVHLLGLSHTDIWAFHIHNTQLGHVRVIEGHGVLEEYVRG